ncbi:MAG: peptidoglycan-binding protein [Gemmobacter sp.]|nr:peptidoglycan-binding protein [Gemmobacter sp.]
MLPHVSRIAIAAVTAVALAAPVPALAWGKKEQNFLAGIAAAVAVGALIKQSNKSRANPAPVYYNPAPVYSDPAPARTGRGHGYTEQKPTRYGHGSQYADPTPTRPTYGQGYTDPTPSYSGTITGSAFREFSTNGRRAIQTRLAEAGYYRGPIDGLWGTGTSAAVQAYARDTGVSANIQTRDGTVQLFNSMIS